MELMKDGFARLGAVGTMPGLLLAGAAPLVIAPIVSPAAAQEVVQPLPNPAAGQLADAMRRLSRSPTSLPALLEAARASIQLDDVDGAAGFADRASAIAPNDGAVLAVRALVALKRQQAEDALTLFAQAGAAGTLPPAGQRWMALVCRYSSSPIPSLDQYPHAELKCPGRFSIGPIVSIQLNRSA